MIWQDIVIMICVFGLGVSLIPTIRGHHKPALLTSILTVVLLLGISFCFITLKLWLSTIAEIVSLSGWVILIYQKRRLQILGRKGRNEG